MRTHLGDDSAAATAAGSSVEGERGQHASPCVGRGGRPDDRLLESGHLGGPANHKRLRTASLLLAAAISHPGCSSPSWCDSLRAALDATPCRAPRSRQTVPRQPQRRPVMDQAGLLQPQRPDRPGTPRRPHPPRVFTHTAQWLLALAAASGTTGPPALPTSQASYCLRHDATSLAANSHSVAVSTGSIKLSIRVTRRHVRGLALASSSGAVGTYTFGEVKLGVDR